MRGRVVYNRDSFGLKPGRRGSAQRVKLFDLKLSEPEPGRLDAVVSGELDLSTVTELKAGLERSTDAPRMLVVDLREVTFLDSSGLRLLLGLDERQRAAGGRLVLVQGGRRVARVFELTGAGQQFEMVADPAEIT